MGSGIVIIIVVVVILGLAGVVLGPIMASKSGSKVGSAFAQIYRQEFGVAPSQAAESAVSQATAIIYNAMGSGQYAYPSENLEKCIREYGNAVGWDESKMEIGLACMGAPCMTQSGGVAPGCKWAVDVIERAMLVHCPSAARRAMGY